MVEMDSEPELGAGDNAPGFTLRGVDNNSYALSDFEDYRALLVVFTCNHCPYAKAKIDELNWIAENEDDVAVIGINPNDEEEYPEDSFEEMQRVVDNGTVKYTAYLRDEDQTVAEAYGAVCTPDPFLFENTGDGFVLRYHGRLDDALDPESEPTEFIMREKINRLLGGEDIEDEFLPSRGCSIKWR